MAVLRLGRFRTGPVGTGEMLSSHAALAPRSRMPFPGSSTCSWRRPATRGEPVCGAGTHPPACRRRYRHARHPAGRAAFSPPKGIATGYAEVVDA
jgi:hypothetical protein